MINLIRNTLLIPLLGLGASFSTNVQACSDGPVYAATQESTKANAEFSFSSCSSDRGPFINVYAVMNSPQTAKSSRVMVQDFTVALEEQLKPESVSAVCSEEYNSENTLIYYCEAWFTTTDLSGLDEKTRHIVLYRSAGSNTMRAAMLQPY